MRLVHDNIYASIFIWHGKERNRYWIKTNCFTCGKEMYQNRSNSRRSKRAFCSRECNTNGNSGSFNKNWGGGRRLKRGSWGHVLIYKPEHPSARKGYIPEHRLVMEDKIGRLLLGEERVHHNNLDMQDNDINNLTLCSNASAHNYIHASLNYCVKTLMDRGYLKFNSTNLQYEVPL
jgi:hypothetical protein